MKRTNNDQIIRRASRFAGRVRAQFRDATSRNQFGPARVAEADARWPSDFWERHES